MKNWVSLDLDVGSGISVFVLIFLPSKVLLCAVVWLEWRRGCLHEVLDDWVCLVFNFPGPPFQGISEVLCAGLYSWRYLPGLW